MRKLFLSSFSLVLLSGVFSGCATAIFPGGPTVAGGVATSVRSPAQMLAVQIDPTAKCVTEGKSMAGAFLGLFAFGDSSLTAAMKNGNITRIHHVDHEVTHIFLGLWSSDTIIVCGE